MEKDNQYDIVEEVDFYLEWFCKKTFEDIPTEEKPKDRILQRMINLGWLRQSEYELYKELTKPKDD